MQKEVGGSAHQRSGGWAEWRVFLGSRQLARVAAAGETGGPVYQWDTDKEHQVR